MTAEAFIICWNEADTIGLTIKHYQQFCDKITLFDNYSTDGSDRIAAEMGCQVIKFGVRGVLNDASYLKIKNYCWKKSTAKWVIICDADEILYHPRLKSILENETEATIFKTQGYQIFSEEMPKENYLEIQTGYPDESYSKRVIFNPAWIADIQYQYGAHACKPKGVVKDSEEILYLLHYRNIGGLQRLKQRHAQYRKRMSEDNKRLGLGCHYMYDDQRREREWYEQLQDSVELSKLGISFSSEMTSSQGSV